MNEFYVPSTMRFSPRSLLLLVFLSGLCVFSAQAQDEASCETVLEDARSAYFAGNFSDAITLLNDCLETEALDETSTLQGYLLLAQAHHALGQEDEARTALASLYALDPEFTPENRLPPPFMALMADVQANLEDPEPPLIVDTDPTVTDSTTTALPPVEQAKPNRRPLYLAGGGALIAAGVLAVVLSGNKDTPSTDWPLPTRPSGGN